MTDLVFQSNKIARRRKTKVIAIAEMRTARRDAEVYDEHVNPATPSNEAMT